MRKIFSSLVAVVAVAAACLAHSAAEGALGQKKKPAEKVSAAEIEKLVANLGDNDFRIRDNAAKQLKQTPGALTVLRGFADDGDLERRRRVRQLIEELSQTNLRRILRDTLSKKGEAPLDLLTELVSLHHDKMSDEDWPALYATIGHIEARVLKGSKTKPKLPDPTRDFKQNGHVPISQADLPRWLEKGLPDCRLTGSDINMPGHFAHCILAAKSSIKFKDRTYSSLFVAQDSIAAGGCWKCIFLTNGELKLGGPLDLAESFVFSAKGVTFESGTAGHSIIITLGRFSGTRDDTCIYIDEASKSPLVTLFSMSGIGLTLDERDKLLRVRAVAAGSIAAAKGFEVDDQVALSGQVTKGLDDLNLAARKNVVLNGELVFQVRRKDQVLRIALNP